MRRRRILLAAFGLLVGSGAAVASPQNATAAPAHVALVIGGSTYCVPYTGASGYSVLSARAGVQQGQGPYRGFVVTINGVGKSPPDATHYWSYWHNTGGGWVYSGAGAGAYTPAAGTVEGWSYVNGSANASPPSGSSSYAAICGALDAPAPPPPAPPATTAAPPPASQPAPPPPATPNAATTRAGTAATPAPGTAPAPTAASPTDGSTPTLVPVPGGTSLAESTGADRSSTASSSTPPKAAATGSGGDSHLPAVLAGVGIVVVLGGGAGFMVWQRRSG